jgi:hypothetical protein
MKWITRLINPSNFSQLRSLRLKDEWAYRNLILQIEQGSTYKIFTIKLLINLSKLDFLQKIPFLSSVLVGVKGLPAGHIANANLERQTFDSLPKVTGVSEAPNMPVNLNADVLIIGSGPGAATAIAEELKLGLNSIVVIERGQLPRTPHGLHHTLTHLIRDFYQAGQELIVATGLPFFTQANVFGGGSEVNSGLYHKLPEAYISKFANAFLVSEEEWRVKENEILLDLDPIEMKVSASSSLLARGSRKIGLTTVNVPRWRTYNSDENFVHRGMNSIRWSKLADNPKVQMYSCLEAVHIDTKDSNFVLIKARNTQTKVITSIRAKRVHVAGGAIATPSLLAKSRLIRWRDTRFAWHPMIRVVASTNKDDLGSSDIDPFQSWTSDMTLKFGSAVSTVPLLAIALSREINEDENLRSFYVSYSSSGRGGILPWLSLPWYRFSKDDKKNAVNGIAMLKKIVETGGGSIINSEIISPKKQSTVHIFGTLPITSSIFIQGTNKLKKDPRIRISDGSIIPYGPGVNPQGVIMTAVKIANRNLTS